MACCPPPSEGRILAILFASLVVLFWLVNPRLGAAATVLLLVCLWQGRSILAKLEAACNLCEAAVRRHRQARGPGRLHCPDCGLRLEPIKAAGPTPHYDCPACSGCWCGSRELSACPALEGKGDWKADSPGTAPLPCPKCGRDLEPGGWAGTPISAHRCTGCAGTWVPRMSWVWLQLDTRRN